MSQTFRSPTRRTVRQRSGFTVSGEKTGSEARVVHSCAYYVVTPHVVLSLENPEVELVPQFERGVGIAAIGGYVKSQTAFKLGYSLELLEPGDTKRIAYRVQVVEFQRDNWGRFGLRIEISDLVGIMPVSMRGQVTLTALEPVSLGVVQCLGLNLDVVSAYDNETVEDEFGADAEVHFRMKTSLYHPEIYYWECEQPFAVEPVVMDGEVKRITMHGEQVVLKACNRCSRFLPIDVVDERHAMGFSNHCVSRAPCQHGSFSSFTIENWDSLDRIDAKLEDKIRQVSDRHVIDTYHGFQLECRPCKKFKVNAPLNPVRNTAQRREDSLRRRAIERLLRHLLRIDWVFYKFRREGRPDEFDTYIWSKFGKECFACGSPLPTEKAMDLDHTLPLAYLWPLDETATCLCSSCNSQKRDKFPCEFARYLSPGKLERLAEITGIDESLLLDRRKHVNPAAVNRLREEVDWFFDDFLAEREYQKIRADKRTADLIFSAIQRVLHECNTGLNLVEEYQVRTGRLPTTVTLYTAGY